MPRPKQKRNYCTTMGCSCEGSLLKCLSCDMHVPRNMKTMTARCQNKICRKYLAPFSWKYKRSSNAQA